MQGEAMKNKKVFAYIWNEYITIFRVKQSRKNSSWTAWPL